MRTHVFIPLVFCGKAWLPFAFLGEAVGDRCEIVGEAIARQGVVRYVGMSMSESRASWRVGAVYIILISL
jgi:hypothetical protein